MLLCFARSYGRLRVLFLFNTRLRILEPNDLANFSATSWTTSVTRIKSQYAYIKLRIKSGGMLSDAGSWRGEPRQSTNHIQRGPYRHYDLRIVPSTSSDLRCHVSWLRKFWPAEEKKRKPNNRIKSNLTRPPWGYDVHNVSIAQLMFNKAVSCNNPLVRSAREPQAGKRNTTKQ